MTTTTPYSDQWRERTRARMEALGIDAAAVNEGTGFRGIQHAIYGDRSIDLEISGPVDEWLAQLEEHREAETIDECDECVVHHPGLGSPRVRRVDVDLGALADCWVEPTSRPHVPALTGDPRRDWRRP
jgi:hypothetical protein